MFCRVTHVQAPEGKVEEGLKLWYDNILPVTKAREGFQGAISMVDLESGKALSITLWEGEEDLIASTEAEYHKKAVERFGEYFEDAHDPENFTMNMFTGPIFKETFSMDEAGKKVAEA
ncbi:MAG TPA: antibiotic biosynthesis monooxygenase [Thermoleophilaceae bacterium]|jgi:hypothetical protein